MEIQGKLIGCEGSGINSDKLQVADEVKNNVHRGPW